MPELVMHARQVEDPVGDRGLREQRPRRDGELIGHRHDLDLRAELARAQLDDLAHREHFGVADVEDRPRAALSMFHRRNDGGGAVDGVAVMVQRQAVVGDDDSLPAVEDAPDDRPLALRRLVRTVEIRIAKVRGVRMRCEHGLFRTDDAVALLVERGIVYERTFLGDRDGQAGRLVQSGVRPPAVRGHTAYGHEVITSTHRRRRDHSEPSVHRDDDVPCRLGAACCLSQRVSKRHLVVRVGVDVHEIGRRLRSLVIAPVQDRDVVPVLDEPLHDRYAARARAADHQDAHQARPVTRSARLRT